MAGENNHTDKSHFKLMTLNLRGLFEPPVLLLYCQDSFSLLLSLITIVHILISLQTSSTSSILLPLFISLKRKKIEAPRRELAYSSNSYLSQLTVSAWECSASSLVALSDLDGLLSKAKPFYCTQPIPSYIFLAITSFFFFKSDQQYFFSY